MPVIRTLFGVLAGYLLFAGSALALFQISGRDPHSSQSVAFMVCTVIYGCLFATSGGFLAALIAGRYEIEHSLAVATLIAVIGATSLLMSSRFDAVWTQLAALLVMAPSAMAGGYLRVRQRRKTIAS